MQFSIRVGALLHACLGGLENIHAVLVVLLIVSDWS
jgi:hypothetical protein